jgi:hypothetical protein
MIMETIIVKAKSKRLAEEVIKKLKKIQGLQIQTSKTWLALDRSLPDVEMTGKSRSLWARSIS